MTPPHPPFPVDVDGRPVSRGESVFLGDEPHSQQRDTLRFNIEFDYSAAAIRRCPTRRITPLPILPLLPI